MIVAMDGPAGAGKSSVAQSVAERLGFQYIDTGAMYRAVGWAASRAGVSLDDAQAVGKVAERLSLRFEMREGVNCIFVGTQGGGEMEATSEIRSPEAGQKASRVAAYPEVRGALLGLQRSMGYARDSVLEGRDIGTVVFPDAEVKIFLTASPYERAVRRRGQLVEKAGGDESGVASVEEIAQEIQERDERDANRAVAPLRAAEDAHTVDTTGMGFEEVVETILGVVRGARQ